MSEVLRWIPTLHKKKGEMKKEEEGVLSQALWLISLITTAKENDSLNPRIQATWAIQ